ncbi:MAG: magnesium transporter [Chloracidobacterium sp.]|nr:magnesium transporter [Chloracidobacterium sp.]MCC6824553.1 magnesium transporter [Acidobacteriota bacterium]MCO5333685.1 magnesium transporter [Pyrinomonadaceae bacterium]
MSNIPRSDSGNWAELRAELLDLHPSEAADAIAGLPENETAVAFRLLPKETAAKVFEYFDKHTQQATIKDLGKAEVAAILNDMAPDDRTAFLEHLPDQILKETLNLLTDDERAIAGTLLGYDENSVGRLMTPYYVQARETWTVKETLESIRRSGRKAETLNVVYVVDDENRLIDDVRIGQFLLADDMTVVSSIIDRKFTALRATMDEEEAVQIFRRYDRSTLPVVTDSGVLVGIVTADDILDVAESEATEDIQKFGGLEALDLPYVRTPFYSLIRKRAGWLIILFLGEMLTASAMGYFDDEIERAVVLALFVPLIISSGGNSGSQAATLIIRAMALDEVTLRDWWYVMRREVLSGLSLGVVLGVIGFVRIALWQGLGIYNYTEHWLLVAVTVFASLIGIVMWGTLSGSMIPFVLRRFGLDPATSSAPFVATLVDVTGLVIYFTIASVILRGTLL